jgi:hypothetical protein
MTRVAYTRLRLPLAKIGKIKSRVLLGASLDLQDRGLEGLGSLCVQKGSLSH